MADVSERDREAAKRFVFDYNVRDIFRAREGPIEDLADIIAQARAEGVEAEAERWGARLDFFHTEFGADGSGCDSGDPLDVIVSEARQVVNRLTDVLDEARAEEREAAVRRVVCRNVLGVSKGLHVLAAIMDQPVFMPEKYAAIRARGEK